MPSDVFYASFTRLSPRLRAVLVDGAVLPCRRLDRTPMDRVPTAPASMLPASAPVSALKGAGKKQ